MDPDALLRELIALALATVELAATGHDVPADTARAAELFLALDGWLSRGGFAPACWRSPAPSPSPN